MPLKDPKPLAAEGTINDHEFTHLTGQRARRLLQLARLFSTSSPEFQLFNPHFHR